LRRATAPLVACAVALTAASCSGDPFEQPEAPAGVDAAAASGGAAGASGAAGGSAAAPVPDGGDAPVQPGSCGPLRSGDAPLFDREVCVPGGTFEMGSNEPNLGAAFADHTPRHTVTVSTYALDAYEVSVARYRACVKAGACASLPATTGCTFAPAPGTNDELPVTCVTWEEAGKFCAWDGARRLPTEAEWEMAAREPGGNTFPWGDKFDCPRAVIEGSSPGKCPQHAGSLPKACGSAPGGTSPHGARDLVGNVAEWASDWIGSYPASATKDPTGPVAGSVRALRGGSWGSPLDAGLGWARGQADPIARGNWGFRCARGAP
jgi:formylglycine-generating enzyme required for sulfatase activity